MAEKWPYFKESFLSYAVIIAVVVVIVAARRFAPHQGPRAEPSVEGINMDGYADQLDCLGSTSSRRRRSDSRLPLRYKWTRPLSVIPKCAGRFRTSARHGLRRADQHIVTDADTFAGVNNRGDTFSAR